MSRGDYERMVAPHDERAEQLRRELAATRQIVLNMVPDRFHELLAGYVLVNSRQESYAWCDKIAEEVISRVTQEVGNEAPDPFHGVRANCPLCGEEGGSPYVDGYQLPEGLRRHLTATYRARECRVMEVVRKLARAYWDEKFRETDEADKAAEKASMADRRAKETLYRLAPAEPPRLVDEGLYGALHERRTEAELDWAARRLEQLSFATVRNGSEVAFVDDRDNLVVYADPRVKGRITFSVFKKPLPKRGSFKQCHYSRFFISDRWKHGIKEKYENRLAA